MEDSLRSLEVQQGKYSDGLVPSTVRKETVSLAPLLEV